MANNKYKKPQELNWFKILQILNGIERHYLKMDWDYEKSSRYQELVKYCLDHKEQLYNDWLKPEKVPMELFWKIREKEGEDLVVINDDGQMYNPTNIREGEEE